MKKEFIITLFMALVFIVGIVSLSACSSEGEMTAQDLYILTELAQMQPKSDCLTSIGCVNLSGSDCSYYYGCIDCFGITDTDDANSTDIEDMFYEAKICGGFCGSSCGSLYWVNFPIKSSDSQYVPSYGCMVCA